MPQRRLALIIMAVTIGLGGEATPQVNAQTENPSRKFAVLAGVNEYPNPPLDKAEFRLRFAQRDVEDMARTLTAQGYQVIPLIGPQATLANFNREVDRWLNAMKRDDLLLIGMAGHGVQLPMLDKNGQQVVFDEEPLQDVLFCPYDVRLQLGSRREFDRETVLSLTDLLNRFKSRPGRKVVLMDACRNIPRDPNRAGVRAFSGDELNGRLPGNTIVMFACSSGQFSRESEKAGGGHGVFFHFVLEGLRGKAASARTGEVTTALLNEFLADSVNASVREWHPDAEADINGEVQTPHMLSNSQSRLVLARVELATAKADIERKPAATTKMEIPTTRGMREGSKAGERMTESGLGTVLVWCPAGRFTMGSPKDEAERDKDEDQVEVELSRGFWMGEHEVTQEEWRKVMERNPSYFSAAGEGKAKVAGQSTERFPVEQVSWEEAREFCRKLTEQERRAGRIATGWEYRLPSEAEWEYACRAGTKSATAYGESLSSKEANFDGNFPYNGGGKGVYLARTNEVGKYEGNGWGLKDMHGNVREWCEDEYEEKLRGGRDPVVAGGEKTGNRVIRGGSWDSSGRYCRSANRVRNTPGIRFNFVGFRLVLGPSRQR